MMAMPWRRRDRHLRVAWIASIVLVVVVTIGAWLLLVFLWER